MAYAELAPDANPISTLAAEILRHPISLQLGRSTVQILDRIANRCLPLISRDEARTLRLCSAAVLFSEQIPRDSEDPRLAHEFAWLLEAIP